MYFIMLPFVFFRLRDRSAFMSFVRYKLVKVTFWM